LTHASDPNRAPAEQMFVWLFWQSWPSDAHTRGVNPDSLGRPTWCITDFFAVGSPLVMAARTAAPISASASSQLARTHRPSPRRVPGARLSGNGMRSGSYIWDWTA
jgi:hypothetical protein